MLTWAPNNKERHSALLKCSISQQCETGCPMGSCTSAAPVSPAGQLSRVEEGTRKSKIRRRQRDPLTSYPVDGNLTPTGDKRQVASSCFNEVACGCLHLPWHTVGSQTVTETVLKKQCPLQNWEIKGLIIWEIYSKSLIIQWFLFSFFVLFRLPFSIIHCIFIYFVLFLCLLITVTVSLHAVTHTQSYITSTLFHMIAFITLTHHHSPLFSCSQCDSLCLWTASSGCTFVAFV